MKKNSLLLTFMLIVTIGCIAGVLVIANIFDKSTKCIVRGCDNYRTTYEDEYCYLHKVSNNKSSSNSSESFSTKSSTSTSESSSKSSSGSSSYSNKSTTNSNSSYSNETKKSSPYQSYDDGYDDIYMDDDYDDERYKSDKDYAGGVDDAMDEFDEDWR